MEKKGKMSWASSAKTKCAHDDDEHDVQRRRGLHNTGGGWRKAIEGKGMEKKMKVSLAARRQESIRRHDTEDDTDAQGENEGVQRDEDVHARGPRADGSGSWRRRGGSPDSAIRREQSLGSEILRAQTSGLMEPPRGTSGFREWHPACAVEVPSRRDGRGASRGRKSRLPAGASRNNDSSRARAAGIRGGKEGRMGSEGVLKAEGVEGGIEGVEGMYRGKVEEIGDEDAERDAVVGEE
ncbi:hypothetical protein C8R44DRAFT_754522 [Mycena epipterygia]|nr:hypothetical protein C8R44DRAFT_754522 [Mycena epipterygia]